MIKTQEAEVIVKYINDNSIKYNLEQIGLIEEFINYLIKEKECT